MTDINNINDINNILMRSAKAAFIDGTVEAEPPYQMQLICNEPNGGENLLSQIERNLKTCRAFYFAAAFITSGGLIALKQALQQAARKNIPGRILTTDYLTFTQPRALKELLQFKNIQLRAYTAENFHVKGYVFDHGSYYTIIIGSGNLTQTALKSNKEWCTRFTSLPDGSMIKQVSAQFDVLWSSSETVDETWLRRYESVYEQMNALRQKINTVPVTRKFSPNKMQSEALSAILQLREKGEKKALLISATGTGKTYLAAFAAKQMKPRRLLFIVHREQILLQAAETFQRVMPGIKTGFLSGQHKDYDAPYLFATSAMMAKEAVLEQFTPTAFDLIIIDETHRAGASGYKRILHYFAPQFLLGMTATPERMDGFDIFSLFDNNIAYEIRLKQAMAEKMLCPFHYFGIADITSGGREIDDNTSFNDLADEQRVGHIIEQAQFFGYSGRRVHGLIFCRTVQEAAALSSMFNARGFNTLALDGQSSQAEREQAISRLEQDERRGGLDYIFTVDIFNEGVDIPAVNQVILLRPTQSAVIFVQQMGRGLRKYKDKEYVVILDFIGSYKNNFMIPIALSGDRSLNKDTLRRCSAEGSSFLPGCSTISFDAVARSRIYAAIDSARLSTAAILKEAYLNLKQKSGQIPSIKYIQQFGDIDISRYFDKFGSYHAFLTKYDSDYTVRFTPMQEQMMTFICKRFGSGKRCLEITALQTLLDRPQAEILTSLNQQSIVLSAVEQKSLIANLTNEFTISNERPKYNQCVFIEPNASQTDYTISPLFAAALQDEAFKQALNEILQMAVQKYEEHYSKPYQNTNLTLYEKYTYEEVCWLLNWPQKINPNAMAGYFYEKTTHTMPVFINYVKPQAKRVDYANQFLSDRLITAFSKGNRKIDSTDAHHIYDAAKEKNKLYLFMRKPGDDKEAKEFYFLGEISAVGRPEPAPKYNGFKIIYRLHQSVRSDLFDYFTK